MGARLGQHFLRDTRVLADIVAASDIQPTHRVLEVGPGPGQLTAELCLRAKEVVAIEMDPALASALQGRYANLRIVVGDAVRQDLAALGRFDRIVANLPYQISGPITIAFLELLRTPATQWSRAVLMFQAEFASRLLAGAGDDAYGRLSVHAARWVTVRKVRDVAPGCFDPPPEVESCVVVLEPHAVAPFQVKDDAIWRAVVDGAFAQRRKKMRNTVPAALRPLGLDGKVTPLLGELGLSDSRPEVVSPGAFAELSNRLAA